MAPRPERLIPILLLLCATVFAFAPSAYLYPNETESQINTSSFFIGNDYYIMVKIKGQDSFLLKGDAPLTNQTEIRDVLFTYYNSTLYPDKIELSDINGMFLAFNASRNAKTRYGNAEDVCKMNTGLSLRDCYDQQSCLLLGSLVCSLQGSTGCDPELLGTYTLDYVTNLNKLTSKFAEIENEMLGISSDNIDSNIKSVLVKIPELKSAAQGVMASKLRFPETTTECPDCIGICPIVPFNFTALDTAKSRLEALKYRIAPLVTVDASAAALAANTNARLSYKTNLKLYDVYLFKFDNIRAGKRNVIPQLVNTSRLLKDSSFNTDVKAMLDKEEEIATRLEQKDFDGMNGTFSDYEQAMARAEKALPNVTIVLTAANEEKDNATDLLTQAEWRVDRGDSDMVRKLNALKQKETQLGQKYTAPMSIPDYVKMKEEYYSLWNYSKVLLDAASASRTNSLYEFSGTLARNGVDGVLSLAAMVVPISYKTRQAYTPYVPTALIFMTDFSLVSLSLVFFIWVVITFRSVFTRRMVLAGWGMTLMAFIGLLAIGSIGFYLLLTQAANTTSFADFMASVGSGNKAAVVLYGTTAPKSAIPSMESCANRTAAAFLGLNKSADIYEFYGHNCTYKGKTISDEECWAKIGDIPLVQLRYSSTNKTPQFSVVFERSAIASGDSSYMQKCDIAEVID